MFKKTVKVSNDNELLTITISTTKRTFITEKRLTFNTIEVADLIPDEFKGCVELISKPSYKISNFTSTNHKTIGEWIYKIKKAEKAKPATTKRSRRKSTRTRRTTTRKIEKTDEQ